MIYRNFPPGTKIPRCPHCSSRNIVQMSGTHTDGARVYYYYCRGCKFSSSGRQTRTESDGDVSWVLLGEN